MILTIFFSVIGAGWSSPNYNLDLINHIQEITYYNTIQNFGVSDVWGYTDETGIEYAIVGYRYGTFIYDVSTNPNSPVLISDIPGPSDGDYYFHRDYKTYGDHLYIVNEMSGPDEGMQVVDLSPLPGNAPIKLSTYTDITQSHNLWIDATEGYAFIENNSSENIHIADLSNPDSPIHLSSFTNWNGANCHDIYSQNGIAYIAEGWSYRFGIYDISDIVDPILLAGIPSNGYAHNAWLSSDGNYLITGEETVGMTVKIWDIQDLNNINLVGEYLGENSLAHNVHVRENFVYISHYTTGIKILDIYDPYDPIEVAAYDTFPDNDHDGFYGCWGAYPFTSNNFVYASDMQYGLFVLEFNDVQAGWVYGAITGYNGIIYPNVEIISTLHGKSFFTDSDGVYAFGFPEGSHEFEFRMGGELIGVKSITILPHETTEQNISFIDGDINNDGIINILDIVYIINQILANEYQESSDINSDGVLNILDIVIIINIIIQ